MVDNEHLKCTATLPLYITSESAVSRTNFSAHLLPLFYEIHIYGFKCCSTREDLSNDVSVINVGLILTELRWLKLVITSQNLISNLFGFHAVVSWKPFHWYINGLCRTDIDESKVISALRHMSKFEFRAFLKKTNFWVSMV